MLRGRFGSGARAAPLMAQHESVAEGGACLVQAKRTRSLPSGTCRRSGNAPGQPDRVTGLRPAALTVCYD